MAKKKAAITGGTILTILILIYQINTICKAIFIPLIILSIISFIIAIAITYFEPDLALYAWIAVIILVLLTLISYTCGYGFYKTEIGKTLVDAGNASQEAVNIVEKNEENVNNIIKNVSMEIIQTSRNQNTY